METLLSRGQTLYAAGSQAPVAVDEMLGEGGQAEVYRARIGGSWHALKWYRREYVAADGRVWERIREAISAGSPTEQFLWPFDVVSVARGGRPGGYLMPLKPPSFVGMVEVMRRRAEPSFRALARVGFELAHSFLRLHAAGLCYRDVNFGNVFLDPATGDIRIADTDNVDVNHRPGGIKGTPGFMAPEVIRDETHPNSATDRFSLAVLLFYLFMLGHPLKGRRELALRYDAADPDGSRRLCADEPVFIFDPSDESNRPEPGVHDAPINFWPIYPAALRRLFTRAFTQGVRDPEARVMENEWRKELSTLRDSLFLCGGCGAENFFEIERAYQKRELEPCWSCLAPLSYPPRMRIGHAYDSKLVALTPGTQLYPHHTEGETYDFSQPRAEVLGSPLSLRNLSMTAWRCEQQDGRIFEVKPGATVSLAGACRIQFGRMQGEVRF